MPNVLFRIIASALTAIAYVVSSAATGSAITFGAPDGYAHPYSAGILVARVAPDAAEPLCSGTLVAPRIVISAAHCFSPGQGGGYDIYVTFDPEYRIGVSAVQRGSVAAVESNLDLAIVWLDEDAPVPPAVLPSRDLLTAAGVQRFTVVGYGITSEGDNVVPNIRHSAKADLASLQPDVLTLSSNPASGTGGACYGDSGGGTFVGSTVVAVLSLADATCSLTRSTRLDSSAARHFLAGQGLWLP